MEKISKETGGIKEEDKKWIRDGKHDEENCKTKPSMTSPACRKWDCPRCKAKAAMETFFAREKICESCAKELDICPMCLKKR